MDQDNKDITILSIESSCDDTSAAILSNRVVLSNVIAGQKVHESYGGVVPELASRAHQQNIVPVVDEAIKQAGINKNQIDAVAFTKGPGLLGSLLVGVSFAKSFAQALNVPIIEVNHMRAHVLAHLIEKKGMQTPEFPFLCLTVSGGHTQIVLVSSPYKIDIVGSTIDDAAGEAFDKTAKLLKLPYPGGPLIDKYAKNGNKLAFDFPKPKVQGLNMSFSGLKTSILYFLQKHPEYIETRLEDVCASIQHTIVSYTLGKLKKAAKQYNISHLAIAGGVSANSYLRSELVRLTEKESWYNYIPSFEYCTDNAAMIGISGYYDYLNEDFASLDTQAMARLPLNRLKEI